MMLVSVSEEDRMEEASPRLSMQSSVSAVKVKSERWKYYEKV